MTANRDVRGEKVIKHPLLPHWRLILTDNNAKRKKLHQAMPFQLFSAKCNRIVAVASLLEYDRALLLEADPNVVLYEENPFRLEHETCGHISSVMPSFLVLRIGGGMTVEEVTTRAMEVQPACQERFDMERMVLNRYGYQFAVLTEEDIRVSELVTAKSKFGKTPDLNWDLPIWRESHQRRISYRHLLHPGKCRSFPKLNIG